MFVGGGSAPLPRVSPLDENETAKRVYSGVEREKAGSCEKRKLDIINKTSNRQKRKVLK
jgi:hypothetical protein